MTIEKFDDETVVVKTIKLDGPNWKMAVRIYCAVLQNADATPIAKTNAEADLMSLATAMDRINEQSKVDGVEFVAEKKS